MENQLKSNSLEIENPLQYVTIVSFNDNKKTVIYSRSLPKAESVALENLEKWQTKINAIDVCIISKTFIGNVRFSKVVKD